jgi:hypothetical protein
MGKRLDGTCAWCGRDVAFQVVFGSWAREDVPGLAPGTSELHEVRRCPRAECYRSTYRVGVGTLVPDSAGAYWDFQDVLHEWPPPGSRQPHQSVPKPIADDWVEAHLCHGIGAYKAAAAMARRAAQGICIEKNAKPGKLVAQIKELVQAGHLHQQLGEWADQVRLFGNTGAHPGDDGLAGVSKQDAEDALAFLDQLLEWTYVAPWKLQQSRARPQLP